MEKRKWLWKRRGSDKSPGGETESSGSLSSLSERYSDEQDALKEFPDHEKQSPEVTSKAAQSMDDEAKESVRNLTEKLSAALVNVSAKEELVKQHAKVAEEAIAGWEKAENDVVVLKQQLDAAVQHNLSLEVRVSHLDGALKECVRQLRHGRDEQEKIIQDAATEKKKWESEKSALEKQLLSLQAQVEAGKAESINPGLLVRLECLEKENTLVKKELRSCSEELEIRTIERDLSTQAAETASKQHLESFKKVTKLEAECRKVQAMIRKLNDHQSPAVSYLYVESVTDSRSDIGDRLYTIENEPSCSNSWASVLISELDQFKNEKATLAAEIDMMDDFLEMEQLAALSETATKTPSNGVPRDSPTLAADDDSISQRVGELEENLEKIEIEKAEVESALSESQDALKVSDMQLKETEIRLEALHKELNMVKESKELLELQLLGMEVEMRSMSANVDCLKKEIEREKALSSIMEVKCYELENEVRKKTEVCGELKIKQEDLGVAAEKLAECQKTIASLGKQLQSLATLEDFLIDTDTENLPLFYHPFKAEQQNLSHSMCGNEGESCASLSANAKTKKLFSRNKSGLKVNDT